MAHVDLHGRADLFQGELTCQPFTTPDTPLVVGILRARQQPEHQPAEDDGQGKNQRCLCE